MVNEFSLSTYSDKADIQKRIESAEFAPGWTRTALAMEKAFEIFTKEQRKDGTTARVCMVFTDGEATDKEAVPAASQKWIKDGVTVFAIGIGQEISRAGLKDIAGADERVLEVENFEALGETANTLVKKVCKTAGHSCFAFPASERNAHVVITPLLDEEIADFTVDMQLNFAEMTKDPFYLSVYSKQVYSDRDNEFGIGDRAIIIAEQNYLLPSVKSTVQLGTNHRLTISRKGQYLKMFWDGKLKVGRKATTHKIRRGASWVLGQEQDTRGGGFVTAQRFIGTICNFKMWNVGLTKAIAPDFFKNPLSIGKPTVFDDPPSYKLELKGAIQL